MLRVEATLELAAYPNERFIGRVQFIYPTLTAATHTLRVRLEFANKTGPGGVKLRPGMYGNVSLDLLAMSIESQEKDDVRVPAGHFIGCFSVQTPGPWGPWQTPSVVCSHPSVPLSGVVRAAPVSKTSLMELVGFGATGAESEL